MSDLSRRRFLQATSAFLGSACLAPTFGDEPKPAFVESPTFDPIALFLTWQRDPTTTMTIQWVGHEEDARTRPIWYAKQGSMEWKQATPGLVRRFPMTDLWIFRTELRGLEPGTDYQFRLGLDSVERRFRTMPTKATSALHFVSGGDSGGGIHAEQTNRLAAAQAPMFVVLGGDLAYENGTDANAFLQFIKIYSKQLIDDQNRLIPMLACMGNHEVRGGYLQPRDKPPFFFAFFDGLFADTSYNVLDFGDYMSLVLLDTNHISPAAGEQTSWLEKTLKEREECPSVFVFNHVPSYPSVRKFENNDGTGATGADTRKHWAPLFERYNVDAVFEHHDHAYKRTHPLLNGLSDRNGIIYLGDGSWGKIRKPKGPDELSFIAASHEAYHLSLHRIEGDQRFHLALSDTGRVVDMCSTTSAEHAVREGRVVTAGIPRLDGVLETALYVDELPRSESFYQSLFGFETILSIDRLCALSVEGRQVLLLFKKGASANLPVSAHDGSGQSHLAFAIPTSELDAWEARLGQQGIAIEEKKTWERGGVSLYFRDPDSHLLELVTPGVWSIY